MNILSLSSGSNRNKFGDFWKKGWAENRPLRWTVIFSAALLIANLIGLLVDTRTLIGEPIWIKPTKFAISSVFYSLSLLWLLTYIKNRPRLVSIVSWVTALAMFGELVLISMQAYRGVRSHFNVASAFDGAVFAIMGIMILSLWLASLAALIVLLRQSFDNRAWGVALKWTLFVTVIGSGLGSTMTLPRASQLEAAQVTGVLPEAGAHTIGAADGGEGLPFLGWSTAGGDLRIGHFIGLHALQVIPLIGLFVIQMNKRKSENRQAMLVHIAGFGYLGIIGLVTWQAFRGEPLIYPSGLTLLTAGGFVLLLVAAVWLTVRPKN